MTEPFPVNENSTTIESKRTSFFEYLFVFILIIYSGHANRFVAEGSNLGSPIWFSIPVVFAGILVLTRRVVFNKQFYLLIFCFIIYFLAITIKYGEMRPKYFLNYFFIFFVAYVTIKGLRFNLFKIYEVLLFYFAIIGLIMWGIQIVIGGDTLYNFFGSMSPIVDFSYVSENGLNIIIYSLQSASSSLRFDFLPPRNCGFAWEPGGFAVYLCLAIFLNLFINNKEKGSTIHFWVLLLALISTQSTTGYVILMVILGYYYLNKKLNMVIVLLPLIVASLILIFSLPFMKDKIVSLAKETTEVDLIVESSIGRETSINPQRFASFMIAFRDFTDNPVLGLGGHDEESWTYKIGANISKITGVGSILSQFGIIGFLFFIIASYKTSMLYAKWFQFKGGILLFIIILFISVSYSIVLSPLIMSFWMFGLFTEQNLDKKMELGLG